VLPAASLPGYSSIPSPLTSSRSFGDLGEDCKDMISYFRGFSGRDCLPEENPAEYMLDVTQYHLARPLRRVATEQAARGRPQGAQGAYPHQREGGGFARAQAEALCFEFRHTVECDAQAELRALLEDTELVGLPLDLPHPLQHDVAGRPLK
jgi:hypothetical protein